MSATTLPRHPSPGLVLFGLTCAVVAILVSDPGRLHGVLFSLGTLLLFVIWLRVRGGDLIRRTWFFALLFLPLFTVTYAIKFLSIDGSGASRARAALEVPLAITLRGLFLSVLSVTTIRSMSASDLHEGLCRIPGPHTLRTIIVGIVFQIRVLSIETGRIIDAIQVRGGSRRAFWGMMTQFPRVWLSRILYRSTRLTDAMTVRDIPTTAVAFQRWPVTALSVLSGALFLTWVATSVAVRVMSPPPPYLSSATSP